MICLALESSTSRASVAIAKDGILLSSRASYISKKHSEFLNPAIEQCLNENNLTLNNVDLLAVSQGPGSFTGIRVSAGAAKTFAYSLNKKIFVSNSLYLLYLQNSSNTNQSNIISMINAYKNMVYFSSYENGQATTAPCALTFEQVNRFIMKKNKSFLIVGDGYAVYEKHISNEARSYLIRNEDKFTDSDYPTAEFLACLATKIQTNSLAYDLHCQTIDWKIFSPLYIRASEAEESLRSRI